MVDKSHIDTIMHASEKSDTCILFYSGSGKDSIALLHMVQPYFKKVVCVYMYLIKDLSFIEPFLRHARNYPNVEVLQIPHPDVYKHRKAGIFKNKADNSIKLVSLKDYEIYLKAKYQSEVVVFGMKITNSFVRRGMFFKASQEPIHFDYGKFYPIVSWTNKEVISYIQFNNLPMPLKLGSTRASSGVSLRLDTMSFIKQHYPKDYEKILIEYPLIRFKVEDYEREN